MIHACGKVGLYLKVSVHVRRQMFSLLESIKSRGKNVPSESAEGNDGQF